jgi:hypothetical protein
MTDAEVLSQIVEYSTHLNRYLTKEGIAELDLIVHPAMHQIEDKRLDT